ncbi:MAG: riboflavin synthase [Syntrophothermus sp.]
MFTGLIQDVGTVESLESDDAGARLRIATKLAPEISLGDSVAVDGVCLTATAVDAPAFEAEAMDQTLTVTSLGALQAGAAVNLELAMRAGDRLGGHIVQGHVDGVGTVIDVADDGFARRVRLALPSDLLRYAIDKGSITVSGVSLTIADLGDSWIALSLIPETLERTNLGRLGPGDRVNVESDVVAKYVERLVSPFAGKDRA